MMIFNKSIFLINVQNLIINNKIKMNYNIIIKMKLILLKKEEERIEID